MDSMAYTVQWSGLVHLGQLPFLLQLISLVFFWNLQTFFVRGVLCLLAIICSFQVHSMTTNAILIVESVFYRVMTGRRRDHFNRMLLFLHTRFSPSLVMFSLELILFTGSEPLRWLYSCIARCVLSATLDYCERRSSAEWAHLTTLGKLFLLALLLGQFFLNLLLWSFYATLSPLEVKQSGDSVRAWYILITDAMAFTLTNAEFILIGIGKLFFGDGVGQPLGGEHIFDVDTQTFQIAVSILTGTLSSIGAWVYAPNLSSVFYQFAILRRIVSTGYRVQALRHYTQMLDNIEDGKGETGEQCSICLEEFGEKELVKRLTCGHYFHRQCLRMWLARSWSCPICRRNSARRPLWENPYDPYMRLTITDTRELHRLMRMAGRREEEGREGSLPSRTDPPASAQDTTLPPRHLILPTHPLEMSGFVQPLVPRMGAPPVQRSPRPSPSPTMAEVDAELHARVARRQQLEGALARRQASASRPPTTPSRDGFDVFEDNPFIPVAETTRPPPGRRTAAKRRRAEEGNERGEKHRRHP